MKTSHKEYARPRIILAGGSGFLGQALCSFFQKCDYEVIILTRRVRRKLKSPIRRKQLIVWGLH